MDIRPDDRSTEKVRLRLEPDKPFLQDGFEVRRHFEAMYPAVCLAVHETLSQPVPAMAQGLVATVAHELAPRSSGLPEDVTAAVCELIAGRRSHPKTAGRG